MTLVGVRLRAVGWAVPVALACATGAGAQAVTVDLMTGSAYNVRTPLTIRQRGYPDIRLTARYDTRPLGPYAPYYAWRVAFWRGDAAWEIQHVHHRLFLRNTTPEVEAFDVHYGYSYLLAGRAWRTRHFVFHAAAGGIITSPANRVRGRNLNGKNPDVETGYDLSGVGAALSLSRAVRLSNHLFMLGDVSLAVGSATVPVVDGSARVPNVGLHGRVGVGFGF